LRNYKLRHHISGKKANRKTPLSVIATITQKQTNAESTTSKLIWLYSKVCLFWANQSKKSKQMEYTLLGFHLLVFEAEVK
jgi:hypothetical protein